MTFRARVIYISLGLLLVIALVSYFAATTGSGQQYAGLEFGLTMLFTAFLEAFILLITGIIIRVRGNDRGTTDQEKADILDAPETRPLTARERGNSFFIAMGLVLLVGASLCFGGLAL